MQLHEVQPIHKNKSKKRIGRGGKRGTYSGRGMKGQKSRAGRKIRPSVRDLIQRTPKLRGTGDKAAGHRRVKKSKQKTATTAKETKPAAKEKVK
jgi:ribosomal protein L15